MAESRRPEGLASLCVAEVLRRGEATVSQVLGAVGRHISDARAVQIGRTELARRGQKGSRHKKRDADPANPIYTSRHLADRGKRQCVNETLVRACRRGLIRRVAPGVYAAPLPRLLAVPEAG